MNQNTKILNLYILNQMSDDELKTIKKERRKNTKKFVEALELDTSESEAITLFKVSNDLRHFGNELIYWLNNNYFQMKRTKQYKNAIIQYSKCKKKIAKLKLKKDKNEEIYNYWTDKLDKVTNELENLRIQFHLTKDDLNKKQKELGKTEDYSYISSVFKLSKAEDIWYGMEKVLFGNGKQLHYKQSNELPMIKAKQFNRGITFKFDNYDNLIINIGFSKNSNLKTLHLKLKPIKEKDLFLQDEYELLYKYLRSPEELENKAIIEYVKNKKLIDIHRICYFSIKCDIIRGRKRVFLYVTVEGHPSIKKKIIKNTNGTITIKKRYNYYNGKDKRRVAFDLGPQSYGFVSKDKIDLNNIGERNDKIIKKSEQKEQKLSRALGRSRMITNSNNYDNNGKIKKGKKTWYKSKNYIRKQKKHRELCRANAVSKRCTINELVNTARTYGNELVIEPSNFNALKKKTKKTKETDKTIEITKKDGTTTTVKKKTKRKRFGKSINRRSPGYLHTRLVSKFVATGGTCIIVENTVKASQYDHELDQFIKKKLSQRFHIFSDGTKVQRDIYSAFLLYCVNEVGTKIDRQKCLDFFDNFYKMFLELENRIKTNKKQICNSGYKFSQNK